MQEARFAGACQDQHAGRPAPSLGWPAERKSACRKEISRCNKPRQTRFLQKSPGKHLAERNQVVQQAKVTGLGASRALGPPPERLPSNTPPKVGGWRIKWKLGYIEFLFG